MSERVEPQTPDSDAPPAQPADSTPTPSPAATPAAGDPTPELSKLVELSTKYPEIGPPLAELAFKIGQRDIGDRVIRMGLDGPSPGIEFYFVAAHTARRERRYEDVLKLAVDGVKAFADTADDALAGDDGQRLLHLVRLGFSALMFDLEDMNAHAAFGTTMAEALGGIEGRLGEDPFYRTLLAQALWFHDREGSEAQWTRAAALGEPESTWNARGTWYREAERDLEKAERAYRMGLERVPRSALLHHNLAQVLIDKARGLENDPGQVRKIVGEAEELLRRALKEHGPKGLRRHVHTTRDRLQELREGLPKRERRERRRGNADPEPSGPPPSVGDTLTGQVRKIASFGVFVALPSGHVGLLHVSQLAHEHIEEPGSVVSLGDEIEVKVLDVSQESEGGRLRIGLSRKALLPAPAGAAGRNGESERGPRRGKGRGPARGKGGERGRGGEGGERAARGDGRGRGGGERGPRRDARAGGGRRDSRDRDTPREWRDRESDEKRQQKQEKLASLGEMLLAKISGEDSKD
ncbi:S1 RNA-binding domain-containing protein [Haliangium sp.]|uniref:S1 RNA-binding domain-containing protein n=1 Tax=Haliangium sp. TaxID=2663208 RepID=UPI003D13601C